MLAGAKFVVININNKEFLTKQQNVIWIFCGFLFCSKEINDFGGGFEAWYNDTNYKGIKTTVE